MVTKKTEEISIKEALEENLRVVNELIKNIEKQEVWTKDDEKRLVKLDKLVGLISKIALLQKRIGKKAAKINIEDDEEIIERFVEKRGKKK